MSAVTSPRRSTTAYHRNYHRYAASIVNTELTSQARGATLKLTPRA